MTNVVKTEAAGRSDSLADLAYEVLKTAVRPMPTPVVANRIRQEFSMPALSEHALMNAVKNDPRVRRFGSGHLTLTEWDGRLV